MIAVDERWGKNRQFVKKGIETLAGLYGYRFPAKYKQSGKLDKLLTRLRLFFDGVDQPRYSKWVGPNFYDYGWDPGKSFVNQARELRLSKLGDRELVKKFPSFKQRIQSELAKEIWPHKEKDLTGLFQRLQS